MPRRRTRSKRTAAAITSRQWSELVEGVRGSRGPDCRPGCTDAWHEDGCPSTFDTEEDALAAWLLHRDDLVHALNPGCRPAAWWRFESGVEHPPPGTWGEAAWLHEHGLLERDEAAALVALAALREHDDDLHDLATRIRASLTTSQ